MFIKSLGTCPPFISNDLCELRELLHPEHDEIPLGYSLAHAVIRPGERSIRHHLEGRTEVYYILSGRGTMHVGDEAREVQAGDALLIPDGEIQFLENPGPEELVFLAIVEPAWQPAADFKDE